MKKKTLKLCGLAFGLSMAVAGIGAAVGASYLGSTDAIVASADTTKSVTLSGGSFANGEITWNLDGVITVKQMKGSSANDVNSSYVSAPRVYKGQILSFVASSGMKIKEIQITCNGTYYGNSMTAGISMNKNTVVDNTSQVTREWTTTSGGKHVIASAASAGLETIYIQNVATASNVQLRVTAISITYGASTVAKPITSLSAVELERNSAPANYGETLSATASFLPLDTDEPISWTSSNEAVATIEGSDTNGVGTITVVGEGSCTFTASNISGDITCESETFTVTEAVVINYTLITDITQLTIGNKVIFVNSAAKSGMKVYDSGNNIKGQDVTESSAGVIPETSGVGVYTVGADQFGYTFKDSNSKYLYAASTSSNYLKARSSLNDDHWDRWNISIAGTGIASIASVGNTDRGVMQFNATSSLFACYASASQTAVKIYALNTNPSASAKVETFSQLFMHKGDVATSDKGTGNCISENWFSKARAALSGSWAGIAEDFSKCGAMWDRYVSWGAAQNPKVVVTYDDGIIYAASGLGGMSISDNSNKGLIALIAIASTGVVAIGGFIFVHKRKQRSF